MKIETLMSGWRITEYGELNFPCRDCVCLSQLDKMKESTANWILANYAFRKYKNLDEKFINTFHLPQELVGKDAMLAWLDIDDEEKIAIMENHPTLEKQLVEFFGEKWTDYYLRFNH